MIQVHVQLFGAFRAHGDRVALAIRKHGCIADVRAALLSRLGAERAQLLAQSRFANANTILAENAPVANGTALAILPPVSGG